ncbi:Retrovirus-related Pol polyprotein from transposon 17.6 [Gossypium australe]|uniref:Retrovirus-related Pol polyprotein from transposon 17.6 n=1 Tax=Gossypium australe TaxID=47621 RepID=A0A5B6X2R6_9ROSI|nr:Retrovirus-related Pol polyprotein from transposon 17.6 [Gossypium australe]
MLAIAFACEKFRPSLMENRSYIYTNHPPLKYIMKKKEMKARIMRWLLLLQEFDLWVMERKGTENQLVDHLLRLGNEMEENSEEIKETFIDV